MKKFRWVDKTGMLHIVPAGSCVICKNCSDIWLDPLRGNEIYHCACEINKEEEFALRKSPEDKFCSGYMQEEGLIEWKE